MAVAAVDEEIFPAAANGLYGAARERKHVARYRPAQARVAHGHAGDDASREMRREAAARDFDFGKLGHVCNARLCGAPNIPKMSRTQMPARILSVTVAGALALVCNLAPAQDKNVEDLNEPTLYDFLLGEIALQRGDLPLAAKTYLELAKRTRDPRIARRAVEVANQARLPELALEAARTWHEIEPASAHALQVLAAMLVAAKRIDEAEPVLDKLLTAEGVNRENAFMQMNRLLAGNPDKASNLRVVRNLAAKHPKYPQAHYAVAQAATIAGDDVAAIAAVRQAQALRPDWEL